MGHFIELCKICGDVISQCRCPDLNKEKRYGVCAKCAAQQTLAVDETICTCSHDVYENVVSPGNCMACGKPFRH